MAVKYGEMEITRMILAAGASVDHKLLRPHAEDRRVNVSELLGTATDGECGLKEDAEIPIRGAEGL